MRLLEEGADDFGDDRADIIDLQQLVLACAHDGVKLSEMTRQRLGGGFAELTAAFLCAELSIPGELRHPEYIGSWLKVLGVDKRAIFTAAEKATEAANYMRSIARLDNARRLNQ